MRRINHLALPACLLTLMVLAMPAPAPAQSSAPVEVLPYLQHPTPDGVTLLWFTKRDRPDAVRVEGVGRFESDVVRAVALDYTSWEIDRFLAGRSPDALWRHRVVVQGLERGRRYAYERESDGYRARLAALPPRDAEVRFIVYADGETEPESTGKRADWPAPHAADGDARIYLADQTDGYRANLRIIAEREPMFIGVAGDLVETGGEQRDWDEFWRHNAGDFGAIASSVPIFAAVGNHEHHHGPSFPGFYAADGAAWSIAKFLTYFEAPANGTAHASRYYSYDVGPIKYITLDVTDGLPHASDRDTNWHLAADGETVDFNPGSPQHAWLERELADGQKRFAFTFVQFHHAPYSVGPHGLAPGNGANGDTQSGVPVRGLARLFKRYGVAAVFAGHDEMYEHSVVDGVHFYDIGIGGDGLRGPATGPGGSTGRASTNPHQVFLAHTDAPESWRDGRLVDGGKHYGHVEVNVMRAGEGWAARITPVYVFPKTAEDGQVIAWERRTYDDEVVLNGRPMAE